MHREHVAAVAGERRPLVVDELFEPHESVLSKRSVGFDSKTHLHQGSRATESVDAPHCDDHFPGGNGVDRVTPAAGESSLRTGRYALKDVGVEAKSDVGRVDRLPAQVRGEDGPVKLGARRTVLPVQSNNYIFAGGELECNVLGLRRPVVERVPEREAKMVRTAGCESGDSYLVQAFSG